MNLTVPVTSAFSARLHAILEEKSMLKHPFYRAWADGTLPLGQMREYARQYYHFEAAFPQLLSSIHCRTDSPEIRQMILDNLWDEEHGEKNHPRLWLDFAAELDVPEDEVKNVTLRPETKALVDHYRDKCRNAPVGEALATMFAYEGQVPSIAWQKIKGLSEFYGFSPHQFEFWSVHLVADIAHSGNELAALETATEDEDAVIEAVSVACDRLLAFLDGCMAEGTAA
jgi:pyrroloquinoline-quinone synthase